MTGRRGPVIARTMTDATSPTAPPEVLPDGAIPAATLVIMRPADGGGPDELLMVKRSAKLAFAAGARVFPGGRIAPPDYRVARLSGFGNDEAAGGARVAPLRDSLEAKGRGASVPVEGGW